MNKIASLIVSLGLLVSGCAVPLAVWQTHKFTDAQQRTAYSQYLTEMEKLNYDRQKNGLPAQPIMSYEQWKNGCPASPAAGRGHCPGPGPPGKPARTVQIGPGPGHGVGAGLAQAPGQTRRLIYLEAHLCAYPTAPTAARRPAISAPSASAPCWPSFSPAAFSCC